MIITQACRYEIVSFNSRFSKYTLLSSNWVQKIMKIFINVGNKIECKYNQIGQEWGGCNEN